MSIAEKKSWTSWHDSMADWAALEALSINWLVFSWKENMIKKTLLCTMPVKIASRNSILWTYGGLICLLTWVWPLAWPAWNPVLQESILFSFFLKTQMQNKMKLEYSTMEMKIFEIWGEIYSPLHLLTWKTWMNAFHWHVSPSKWSLRQFNLGTRTSLQLPWIIIVQFKVVRFLRDLILLSQSVRFSFILILLCYNTIRKWLFRICFRLIEEEANHICNTKIHKITLRHLC